MDAPEAETLQLRSETSMPADPGAGSAGPGGKRGPPAPPPGAMKKMKKGPLNMEVSRAESTDTK